MDEAPDFLRGLAERLMRIPVMYGTDQSDVDRLLEIANEIEATQNTDFLDKEEN